AVSMNDGVDYVPAKKGMLMGQHFSAVAAAGPINGPILAGVLFGWVPALLWVLLGSVFIGGIHDMGSLVASIRHKARSITEVIRINVSTRAWVLFMLFIWLALVYVIIAFTDITASSFVGVVTLESGQTVAGGAIASSSVMYLILTVIMGLMMKFLKLREGLAVLVFLPLVALSIWGGQYLPINLPVTDIQMAQKIWGILIIVYCMIASIVPVWLLLQPRGALGGYFLYASLFFAAVGLIFGDYSIQYPAFTNLGPDSGMNSEFWFPMFPILFITVACGACSGFHAFIASGTTSKQLARESDAKPVGFGVMLIEGMFAVVSIACVMILSQDSEMAAKAPNFIYASAMGSFMELIGVPASFGITFGLLAFTTFVYDTLDIMTRLGRYIIEELTGLKTWTVKLVATLLTAGIPVFFLLQTMTDASGNIIPTWRVFWNTFGASNQLLGALALLGITVWLMSTRKNSKIWLVAFIPAVVMFVISNWALALGIYDGWVLGVGHPAIPVVSMVLIILSALVAVEAVSTFYKMKRPAPLPQDAGQ
ncbi:MAG: carbon starvation protein A, partial [Bacillota bacterium]